MWLAPFVTGAARSANWIRPQMVLPRAEAGLLRPDSLAFVADATSRERR